MVNGQWLIVNAASLVIDNCTLAIANFFCEVVLLKQRVVILLILLLLAACLTACSREEPTPTATATAVPEATIPAAPTPTRTPAPTATPITPALSVSDQALDIDGVLVIDSVTVLEPAWVVIHAERDGVVGEVLGQTAVSPGATTDVEITIDPLQATDALTAMIHDNAGSESQFDFPGQDNPLLVAGSTIAQSFAIDRQIQLPEIQASDQDVLEDGLVRINSVRLPKPGWIVIHAQENEAVGPVLGFTFVQPGVTENVVVHIPWREATPTLYAMLYEDTGREQRFDFPEEDLPILAVGEPVVTEIQAAYPPNLVVFDQPVIDNRIVVERVISSGPGWLVVYADDGGSPGIIIGSAALAAGLNEAVSVGLLGPEVTDQLFIFLHQDTEAGDAFNFPAADPQLMYQGRIANPFSFRTDPGNYLGSRDQVLQEVEGETAVLVPFTVTEVDAWIVIYNDNNGDLGDIIGQAWLPPGVNREVIITIDPEAVTDTLYAVLQWDAGTVQTFEPGGTDIPFQRNRSIIQAPFSILSE